MKYCICSNLKEEGFKERVSSNLKEQVLKEGGSVDVVLRYFHRHCYKSSLLWFIIGRA
jgi:hypothetical protein